MAKDQSASPVQPIDEFQKRLLEMPAEEIRERLYRLPFAKLQQILLNVRPSAPAQPIAITVKRRQGKPIDLAIDMQGWKTLKPNEQIVWVCPDGRLEIRFDPSLSPFAGDSFEVPQSAKAFSGRPDPKKSNLKTYRYAVLVTTSDGFFLRKDAEVVIERVLKTGK